MPTDLRDLIASKRDGQELSPAELEEFVTAAARGTASEEQLSAMLMAIFIRGMSDEERTGYALAMMNSGEVLSWEHLDRPTVDKHSTGGVGDKVSLVWAPLMAAMGYAVPMISGRGLGHTGGTLDKLEAIPGFRTDLSSAEMNRVVERCGCVITGQTADLVPADRTLYDLRSRTATVPSIDHIAPSILSKKLAEGAETLVLDVKVGRGAFMKTLPEARQLAEVMVAIGTGAGRNTAALLTRMEAPLGRSVGNANEVRESIEALCGRGPADLRELVLALAESAIVARQPTTDRGELRSQLEAALDDGRALHSMRQMVEAQSGDPRALDNPSLLLGIEGSQQELLLAPSDGWIGGIDALDIGLAAAALGGGRGADGSAPDPGVGVDLELSIGAELRAGQPWARLHHRSERGLEQARALAMRALRIEAEAPDGDALVLGAIGRVE
ncbi:MAG: thymidine phosphorylase [Rickettsiales bacterium]|nr:thymidine phosphorylase [Rickettsiales bacterium]